MEIEPEDNPERELGDLRSHIDGVDIKILSLLAERVKLVRMVGKIKRKASLPIIDQSREADKIQSLVEEGSEMSIPKDEIIGVWTAIFHASYKIEET